MKSLSTSITHTVAKIAQVHAQKTPRGKRYGMLPDDVLANPELSPAAKVILAAMAMEAYGTGSIGLSHQAIASVCGIVRRTVGPALAQLQQQKLIQPIGEPIKQIQRYALLHPKHESREQATESESPIDTNACGKCKQSTQWRSAKTGYCRKCERETKGVHPKVFAAIDAKVERHMKRLKAS